MGRTPTDSESLRQVIMHNHNSQEDDDDNSLLCVFATMRRAEMDIEKSMQCKEVELPASFTK